MVRLKTSLPASVFGPLRRLRLTMDYSLGYCDETSLSRSNPSHGRLNWVSLDSIAWITS